MINWSATNNVRCHICVLILNYNVGFVSVFDKNVNNFHSLNFISRVDRQGELYVVVLVAKGNVKKNIENYCSMT